MSQGKRADADKPMSAYADQTESSANLRKQGKIMVRVKIVYKKKGKTTEIEIEVEFDGFSVSDAASRLNVSPSDILRIMKLS
jgi:D-lyxose ketol-isomerase